MGRMKEAAILADEAKQNIVGEDQPHAFASVEGRWVSKVGERIEFSADRGSAVRLHPYWVCRIASQYADDASYVWRRA